MHHIKFMSHRVEVEESIRKTGGLFFWSRTDGGTLEKFLFFQGLEEKRQNDEGD
jgi:hypothetical protein